MAGEEVLVGEEGAVLIPALGDWQTGAKKEGIHHGKIETRRLDKLIIQTLYCCGN